MINTAPDLFLTPVCDPSNRLPSRARLQPERIMHPETVPLVRESWQAVAAIAPQAAALFYQNLFEADPSLRRLFRGDMETQGRKLMEMIGVAVAKLDRPDALVHVLRALGKRHADYGVQASHYDTVGAALLRTLGMGLGDRFTPEVEAAWTEVYGFIAETMLSAADELVEEAA